MTKTATILASLLVLGLLAGGWWLYTQNQGGEPAGKISAETDTAIRAQIMAFGNELQNVSLLSTSTVAEDLDSHYGQYLSAELLASWKNNPERALGRLTSSPWPDRI